MFSSPQSLVLSTFYRYMDSELNKFAQVTELTRNLSGYKAHFLSTVNHLPLILLYFSGTGNSGLMKSA